MLTSADSIKIQRAIAAADFVAKPEQSFIAIFAALDEIDSPVSQEDSTTREVVRAADVNDIQTLNYLRRMVNFTRAAFIALNGVGAEEDTINGTKAGIKTLLLSTLEGASSLSETSLVQYFNQMMAHLRQYNIDTKAVIKCEHLAAWDHPKDKTLKAHNSAAGADLTDTPINIKPVEALQKHYGFLNGLAEKNKDTTVPNWFQQLKKVEQQFLIRERERILSGEIGPSIPTLRRIPGLANTGVHQGVYTGKLRTLTNKVTRHGTLSHYGIKDATERFEATRDFSISFAEHMKHEADDTFEAFWSEDARNNAETLGIKPSVAEVSFMSVIDFGQQVGIARRAAAHRIREGAKRRGYDVGESSTAPTATMTTTYNAEAGEAKLDSYIPKTSDELAKKFSPARGLMGSENNRPMKVENVASYGYGVLYANKEDAGKYDFYYLNMTVNDARGYTSKTFTKTETQVCMQKAIHQFGQIKKALAEKYGKNMRQAFASETAFEKFKMAQQAKETLQSLQGKFGHEDLNAFPEEKRLHNERNPELFADCCFAVIIQAMGGEVSASCKSSKDRTGLFLIGLDAVHAFYAQHGAMPDITNDKHWEALTELMAELYVSNLQQLCASEQTYGAAGLKEPHGSIVKAYASEVWPPDVLKKIEEKCPGLFKAQVGLAESNKISKLIEYFEKAQGKQKQSWREWAFGPKKS